jgi:hypothetical protein
MDGFDLTGKPGVSVTGVLSIAHRLGLRPCSSADDGEDCDPADDQRSGGGLPLDPTQGQPDIGLPLSTIGSEFARTDEKTREVATAAFERLVGLPAGNSNEKDSRGRALVVASTMIGAETVSRVVNNSKLSAEIRREAEKSLMAARS